VPADLYVPVAHASELHWYFIPLIALPVLIVLYGAIRYGPRKPREKQPPRERERA
jgi:hypothetical protein